MTIWKMLLAIVLILLVIQRANLVAFFAKQKYNTGDRAGGIRLFQIADKVGNLNKKNKLFLGYALLREGRLDEARVQLNFCLNLYPAGTPDRNRVRNQLALLAWKEGNLEDAIEILEEVLASGYRNTLIYQNLGIFYNLKGDLDKALEFNLSAYEYNNDDAVICDNLADTYAMRGEYQKAEELYQEMMGREQKPRFPEAYYGYGKVLIALGKKEEGAELLREALDKPFSYLSICTKEEIEQVLSQ